MNDVAELLTPEQIRRGRSGVLDIVAEGLYDKLFEFYAASGDMPYGTMKARTGDPDQWIEERLQEDLRYG